MDLPTQTHLTTLRDMLSYRLKELRAEVRAAERDRRQAEEARARGTAVDGGGIELDAAASAVAANDPRSDVDEMERVEAALERLERNVYGDCLHCGEPIALQRLLAQPALECCAACQARRDPA